MATWVDDITGVLRALGGTATYDEIYAAMAKVRPTLPQSWKQIIQRQIQDHSSDSAGYKGGHDLYFSVQGLGSGVWGLRAAVDRTPVAADLPLGNETPERTQQTTYRLLRDTKLAREIKLLHRNACQICGIALQVSPTRTYAEAHHVIPLGSRHNGPDIPGNILVLCPNHHAMCDMGAILLSHDVIRSVYGHHIADESIDYHNRHIYGSLGGS